MNPHELTIIGTFHKRGVFVVHRLPGNAYDVICIALRFVIPIAMRRLSRGY